MVYSWSTAHYWEDARDRHVWRLGVRDLVKKGTLLHSLKHLPVLRAPVLRDTKDWSLARLHQNIALKKYNVEALYAQLVGTVKFGEEQCKNCQMGCGPFLFCVLVIGLDGMPECACCHYGGQKHRCSFRQAYLASHPGQGDNNYTDPNALKQVVSRSPIPNTLEQVALSSPIPNALEQTYRQSGIPACMI
ncbi:uncharacterized protein N7483_010752 [Penicillium malachiteum]|uniref:uncharacterized protein n=1 Tax=Penicillium malachiteum TaxID=1324776 RepID=UPI0025494EAD|nr:uncharacterized protein N7483_010752 [Penicillium malachiteum]KAJ5713571.1 hypothetical protein N7483_010752 [Penicillium malachiteum]